MRMIPDEVTFTVEEMTYQTYTEGTVPMGWEARMEGVGHGSYKQVENLSTGTESDNPTVFVTLTRYGNTPDEAMKRLFEGMHDAGISL